MRTARSGAGPLAAWLAAEVCSLAGTRLSMVAVPWLVLTTTGSAAWTGTVAFAEMLPYVLAKGLGGPLVDRVGTRRIAVACDLGSMVVVGMIPLLHTVGALRLGPLVAIVAVAGFLRGPSDAAKQAIIPALAEHAHIRLERVTGAAGTVERLATTVGAAAAGALVAVVGAANALAVNAATFALAALLMLIGLRRVRQHVGETAADVGTAPTSYLRELREGVCFLRSDRLLVIMVTMIAGTNFLDQGFTSVLVPVWVREAGHGAEVVGLIFAVMSAASVVGSLLATAFGPHLPRLLIYTVGFIACGLPRFLVLALHAPLAGVLTVMAIAGLTSGLVNPIVSAVIFERLPARLVGRVSALVTSLAWSLIPVGGLMAGVVVSGVGNNATLAAFGIAYAVLTLLPVLLPTFRQLNERSVARSTGAVASSG